MIRPPFKALNQEEIPFNERSYFKKTTMQKGIVSLLGILLVSSGCPVMAKLRPMVRFHLPFASMLATTFRTTITSRPTFRKNPGRTVF
jgi:Domain of unknown function (DUF6901)